MTTYTDGVTEEHREKKARKVFRLGDVRLYECPLSLITPETAEVMRMVYLADGSGVLPEAGGWSGQPHWFVEAREIFATESLKQMKEGGDGKT